MPFVMPAATAVAGAVYSGALAYGADPIVRGLLVGSGPLLFHVIIPALDFILGEQHPAPRAAQSPGTHSLAARVLPLLSLTAQAAAGLYGLAVVATAPLQPALAALLAVTLGINITVAIGAAHELIHSRNPLHLAAARAFLTVAWWYPYLRAHPHHHLHVATPADATTARKGELVFTYLPKFLGSSYAQAWELSAEDCRRSGHSVFSIHNGMLMALIAQPLSVIALATLFSPLAAAVHMAAVTVMLTYMTAFDYILHYGLERPQMRPAAAAAASPTAAAELAAAAEASAGLSNGLPQPQPAQQRYAPVTQYSAWSSLYPLENAMLYNVLYHAGHHVAATKSHGWLRPADDTPSFPGPANLVALTIFVPPLWMAIMDKRAAEANQSNRRMLEGSGVQLA